MPSLVAFTAFTALVAINAPSEEQTPAEGVYLPTNEAQLKNTPQDLGVVEIWRYRGGTTNRIAGALSAEGPDGALELLRDPLAFVPHRWIDHMDEGTSGSLSLRRTLDFAVASHDIGDHVGCLNAGLGARVHPLWAKDSFQSTGAEPRRTDSGVSGDGFSEILLAVDQISRDLTGATPCGAPAIYSFQQVTQGDFVGGVWIPVAGVESPDVHSFKQDDSLGGHDRPQDVAVQGDRFMELGRHAGPVILGLHDSVAVKLNVPVDAKLAMSVLTDFVQAVDQAAVLGLGDEDAGHVVVVSAV